MAFETTLAIIKPDGVFRHLTQNIVSIFNENNLTVYDKKIVRPSSEMVTDHMNYRADYALRIGQKVLGLFEKKKMKQSESFLADMNPVEIGDLFKELMTSYIASGVNIAFLLQGEDAIERTKKLCGATYPADADKNSIRGMYGTDSFEICTKEKRVPRNILHVADSWLEASHQIKYWFPHVDLEALTPRHDKVAI